jgi:hypothetical protein
MEIVREGVVVGGIFVTNVMETKTPLDNFPQY